MERNGSRLEDAEKLASKAESLEKSGNTEDVKDLYMKAARLRLDDNSESVNSSPIYHLSIALQHCVNRSCVNVRIST